FPELVLPGGLDRAISSAMRGRRLGTMPSWSGWEQGRSAMTLQDEQDWVQLLGLDRLPEHIIGKRVTELMDLSGKKAFGTGAGGDGLGQAIANRLAGCGADVALIGRTFEKVQRRATEVERRWGVRALPVKADMSDWDQVHDAVQQAQGELGGLDIMVNNPVMV